MFRFSLRLMAFVVGSIAAFSVTCLASAQQHEPIEKLMRGIQARWKEVSHDDPIVNPHHAFNPAAQRGIVWSVGNTVCPYAYPPDGYFNSLPQPPSLGEQMQAVHYSFFSVQQPYRFFVRPTLFDEPQNPGDPQPLTAEGSVLTLDFNTSPENELHNYLLTAAELDDQFGVRPTASPSDSNYDEWFAWFQTALSKMKGYFRDLQDGLPPGDVNGTTTTHIVGELLASRNGLYNEPEGDPECDHACANAFTDYALRQPVVFPNPHNVGIYDALGAHRFTFGSNSEVRYHASAGTVLRTGYMSTTLEPADWRGHCGKAFAFLAAYQARDGSRGGGNNEPFPPPVSPLIPYDSTSSDWTVNSAGFGVLHLWQRNIQIGGRWNYPLVGSPSSPPELAQIDFISARGCPGETGPCDSHYQLSRATGWFVGYPSRDEKCPSLYLPRSRGYASIFKILLLIDFWDTDASDTSDLELPATENQQPNSQPSKNGKVPKKPEKKCEEKENPKSKNPVDVATGDKFEQTIDLSVAISGGSFEVARGYSSHPGMYTTSGYGLAGANWNLSLFRRLRVGQGTIDNPTSLTLGESDTDGQWTFVRPAQGSTWATDGPTTQQIETGQTTVDSASNVDVWRLVDPGVGTMEFYRKTSTNTLPPELDGLLLRQLDTYGNETRYRYTRYRLVGSTTQRTARLSRVDLLSSTSPSAHLDASILLDWITDCTPPSNAGRVRSMTVLRFPSSGSPVVTDRVQYLYRDTGNASQVVSNDVGTSGDLIQVTKYQLVDREVKSDPPPQLLSVAPQDSPAFRVQVTQYRYHDGAPRSSSTDERLATRGLGHQLKSVFLPEQIEYLAQQRRTLSIQAAATDLLRLADGESPGLGAGTAIVADYAAKIATYENATDSRVAVEYVQTSCGCSGSTQGLKQAFSYGSGTSGPTMTVTESQKSTSGWTLYRTLNYETEAHGAQSTRYLKQETITEPGSGGRTWTWSYEYDTVGNLVKEVTPAANAAGGASGLVHLYAYNAENRRTETKIANGVNGPPQLISKVYYPSSNGANQRTYLPWKIERYADATSSAANTIETVLLQYGFFETSVAPDGIAWSSESVEAELESENGPSTATTYVTYELFSPQGLNIWTRSADNVLKWRSFDPSTGMILNEVANADPGNSSRALPTSYPEGSSGVLSTQGWGLASGTTIPGGEISTRYAVDFLGRLILTEGPGGARRTITREMRANALRPGPLYFAEVQLPASVGSEFEGPSTVAWFNAADRAIRQSNFVISSVQFDPTSGVVSAYTYGTNSPASNSIREVGRQATEHHLSGLVQMHRRWPWIDADGESPSYQSTYAYDQLGRLLTSTDGTGTITKNSLYDVLGRVLQIQVGTDDGANGNMRTVADYTYDGSTAGAQGVGNGNVTHAQAYTGENGTLGGNTRTTVRAYDFRDRLTSVTTPAAPQSQVWVYVYDNLDRMTEKSLYDRSPISSAVRGLYVKHKFGQRGLSYRTEVAIDPQNPTTFLQTNRWFDPVGRVLSEWEPSKPSVKRKFDAHGRATTVYVTDRAGDPAPGTGSYSAATSASDDFVFDQVDTTYDGRSISGLPSKWTGLPLLVTTRHRLHDASQPGVLSDSNAITTYQATWYDDAQRPVLTADYGTNDTAKGLFKNGNSAPALPHQDDSIPTIWTASTNPERLLSGVHYDERGLVNLTRDADGRATKLYYDHLGRRFATIEGYEDGYVDRVPDGTNWAWQILHLGGVNANGTDPNRDRLTWFDFNANDAVVRQKAYKYDPSATDPSSAPQVTEYVYGSAAGSAATVTASLIASNSLLTEVRYPNEENGTAGSDSMHAVKYAYNGLGELRSMTDQSADATTPGTRHEYSRDAMGRVTADYVGAFRTGIDTRVNKISVSYDGFGRVTDVLSGSGANGNTTVNAVRLTYTPLWQVAKVLQDHDGPVQVDSSNVPLSTGNTQSVEYSYSTSGVSTSRGNYLRLNWMAYPDGTKIYMSYGTGTPGERVSRPFSISGFNASFPNIVEYTRAGFGIPVLVDYPQADVQLDRTLNPPDSSAGSRRTHGYTTAPQGTYAGLDKFGRVLHQAWIDGNLTTNTLSPSVPSVPPILHETYTYLGTERSDRTDARPGKVPGLFQDLYSYDGLGRLTSVTRKSKNSTGGWDVTSGGQDWSLDMLGNWDQVRTQTATPFDQWTSTDRAETRGNNAANQLGISSNSGRHIEPGNVQLPFTYDASGNLYEAAREANSTSKDRFTHDAWNRLVKHEIIVSNNAVAPVASFEYNGLHWRTRQDTQILPFQTRLLYYSSSWQLVEEHVHDMGDEGSPGFNKVIQEVFGFQYIDDAVLRRVRNAGEGAAPNRWVFTSTTDTSYYHLTDPQFSTLAMIGTGQKPALYERLRYDAYGPVHHRWGGDVDGDGDNDVDDKAMITTLTGTKISDAGYHPDADRNRDGLIDSNDILANVAGYQAALPAGSLSAAGYADNVFGYCGYAYVPASGLYSVRARWYSPDLGRWLERDPIGYSEGTNLFEYVGSEPTGSMDPLGLFEVSGHYYTTFIAARCAGMSMTDSMHLAYYSQYPDQVDWLDAASLWKWDKVLEWSEEPGDQRTRAQSIAHKQWMMEVMELIHSLHGGDAMARRACLAKLLRDPSLSREERGVIIHAFGDSFAHTYVDSGGKSKAYDAPNGHLVDSIGGDCPDCLAKNRSGSNHSEYFRTLCIVLGGNTQACSSCAAKVDAYASRGRSIANLNAWTKDGKNEIIGKFFRRAAEDVGLPSNAWSPEAGGTSGYFRQLTRKELENIMSKIKKACCK